MATRKIEISLPVVRLRVEDFSYLHGIANREGAPKCSIPAPVVGRLLLLGLIERVEIPVDPMLVLEFEKKRQARLESIRQAVKPKNPDWNAIRSVAGGYWESAPRATADTRITAAGRNLIANGTAQVEVKASCK